MSENIDDPSLKAIGKYRKNPSIIVIASELIKEFFFLFFNTITIEVALKEISMLDSSKVIQATDIPVKVMKGNSIFYSTNIMRNITRRMPVLQKIIKDQ